jgi:Transposase, Mutator family
MAADRRRYRGRGAGPASAGRNPATVFAAVGLVEELKKRLTERINGYGAKPILTDTGELELTNPRNRRGRFGPLIGKYRPMVCRLRRQDRHALREGMTTLEIAVRIGELYSTEISPDLRQLTQCGIVHAPGLIVPYRMIDPTNPQLSDAATTIAALDSLHVRR